MIVAARCAGTRYALVIALALASTRVIGSAQGQPDAPPEAAPAADPSPAALPPAPQWTLEACVRAALNASPRLTETGARAGAAEAAASEARAQRWPHLSLRGGYAYISETMQMPLGKFVPGLPSIELGTNHSYDVQLGAEVALFTGGALGERIAAREAAARASRHEQRADTLIVLREVRTAFFAALAAEAQARASELAEGRLARHIEDLQQRIAAGASSEEARTQAMARLREAQIRRAEALATARAARLDLGRRSGCPGEEIDPDGRLDRSLLPPGFSAETGADPAQDQPALRALAERMTQSRAQVAAARAGYYPTILAQASVHEGRPGVDPIADAWMSYATAGLALEWSVWEWGARANRVEQARAAERAARARHDDLSDHLIQALALARVRWESAREQAHTARERADLERRRLELVKGRYAGGAATETERLDAEDDLAEAETAQAAARARLRLSEVELLYFLEEVPRDEREGDAS